MIYTRMMVVLLACALAGCASSGSGEVQQRRDPNVITLEEMRTAPRTNALDLVQTRRPQWLRVRGPTTFSASRESPVQVYVDNVHIGGPEQLRGVPVPSIESLQYLNPQEASSRFGFDHLNGAILITTRVGTSPR